MAARDRYHPLSIGLHWLMAAIVIVLIAVGFVMDDLPQGGAKYAAFNTHKLFGVVVLALVALRLFWRATHPPPADALPAWQRALAQAAHGMLYAAMIAMPVTGLLFTNFGKGIRIFGLSIAPIGGANETLKELFEEAHEAIGIALAALAAAHVVAALWHHFGRRDATLLRMLPRGAAGS
jgi:cytochrome b561